MISIDMPSTLTSINDTYAFLDCTSLTTINYDNLKIAGKYAFSKCSFETISLEKCTFIEQFCFRLCTNLKTVYSPNLRRLEAGAFQRCSSLNEIHVGSDFSGSGGFFSLIPSTQTIKVYIHSTYLPNATSIMANIEQYKGTDCEATVLYYYNPDEWTQITL